jgi:hypothetical protein
MKTTTISINTLETLLELARKELDKMQENLQNSDSVQDAEERAKRIFKVAKINRGLRAVDEAEKKVTFS